MYLSGGIGLRYGYDYAQWGAPFTVTTYPAGLSYTVMYNGSTNFPTEVGSYPLVVTVNDAKYSGTYTNTLTIFKANQTIAFAPLGSSLPLKDLPNVPVSATASSGLPVTLSLDPGSAANLGGTLTDRTGALNNIQSTGTVTLRAVQGGNASYNPATNTITFNVTKNNQSITFSNLLS